MPEDLDTPAKPLQPSQTVGVRPVRRVVRRKRRRPITQGSGDQTQPQPSLRLVGVGAPDVRPPTQNPTPIDSATDPRWVLAVRTAEMLEGDVLPPDKREALMRTGKVMGLSPFDCSLVLAIVQDRARRGVAPERCPAAGKSQLALIPLPRSRSLWSAFTDRPGQTLLLAAGMLALQALVIWMLLG
ncbi:MAG: hypothetical protein ACE37H_02115 [Phycisphaeraceae bacterium]